VEAFGSADEMFSQLGRVGSFACPKALGKGKAEARETRADNEKRLVSY